MRTPSLKLSAKDKKILLRVLVGSGTVYGAFGRYIWRAMHQNWCGRGDLNPHAFRRHPLKMVCLPVPPLPQVINCLIFNNL
jgi:hypothetical protein